LVFGLARVFCRRALGDSRVAKTRILGGTLELRQRKPFPSACVWLRKAVQTVEITRLWKTCGGASRPEEQGWRNQAPQTPPWRPKQLVILRARNAPRISVENDSEAILGLSGGHPDVSSDGSGFAFDDHLEAGGHVVVEFCADPVFADQLDGL